jgi:excisionase family DNA binding protein
MPADHLQPWSQHKGRSNPAPSRHFNPLRGPRPTAVTPRSDRFRIETRQLELGNSLAFVKSNRTRAASRLNLAGPGARVHELRPKGGGIQNLSPVDTNAEEMQESATDEHRLLTPEDVARACALSRRAVYRAINRGELRAARLCNRLRIEPEELRRWFEEMAVSPPPPAQRRSTPIAQGGLRARLRDP